MTGSMFLVLVIVLAGIFYLLLRRRGSRDRAVMKPLRSSGAPRTATESPDLKPFRANGTSATAGIPPRPQPIAHDSGSSHPAYPVAPAKYSGAPVIRTDAASQREATAGSGGRVPRGSSAPMQPEAGTTSASGREAPMPPPAEPWYPEAPASYTDEDEPADRSQAEDPGPGR